MPFFSVIIPLFNKEKHINTTLASVLSQTFDDFEIIVINDGSTDNSLKIVEAITDSRIVLHTIKNQGVSFARNHGIEKASSNLVVFLDADDNWLPNHLENLKKLYNKFPDCGLYATAYTTQTGGKFIPSEYYNIPKTHDWMGIVPDFFESCRINCIASSSSVMIPKTVFKAIGAFNVNYNSGEDIDLWIRIGIHYKVAFTKINSVIITTDAKNRVSQFNINQRQHIGFDDYKEELTNESLKQYLDLNRFALAIQHRVVGNPKEAKQLIDNIQLSNLTYKQRFLLHLNAPLLKSILFLKNWLHKSGIHLSSFK